jgi:hypothetical protein
MAEKNYVINVKTKAGTIFTVRADSATELNTNVQDVIDNATNHYVVALEELLLDSYKANPIALVEQTLGATVISETPIEPAPAFAPKPPPAQTTTSPSVGDKTCVHGVMIRRTGESAKGEWRAFFCPTPKGTANQCQAEFAKRGTAEWNGF